MEIKPQLLTIYQVSVIIQVHPNTVRNYVAEGKLKGHNPNGNFKGLRITVESVEKFLQSFLLDDFNARMFENEIEKISPPAPKTEVKINKFTGRPRGGWLRG